MPDTTTIRRTRLFYISAMLVALAAAAALVLAQEGREARAVEAETPEYRVLDVSDAAGVREVVVTAAEPREAGMRLIDEELRDAGNLPEDGTLLVEYRKDDDPERSTGFALVFDSVEAVLAPGRYSDYGEADAEQIMEEEDGIRVVGFREFAEENPTIWEQVKQSLV
ncbi:hypothetical protein Rxyl_2811 [Rubrobacter xylanophilus DSM 9941]|uniref:Uncharacterized protein n=1 Tax=Rubrobacter xylanophilus (strain DSM 9941 / JCM 11954 / NBRC 16129 / PRD-1) TaxID=266117 RepID=Q1ASA4_RUBXD|nr:hypothetical protein [Rubrobacter xylanophilus]ABG05724.1 hypothetical protein Rxyl_2811 [Rubrobacter xylanophilus DSM 9941]